MIIIDTNVLSELMRSRPEVRVLEWVDTLHGNDLGITAVSVAEILYEIASLLEGKKSIVFSKRRQLFLMSTLPVEFLDSIILLLSSARISCANARGWVHQYRWPTRPWS